MYNINLSGVLIYAVDNNVMLLCSCNLPTVTIHQKKISKALPVVQYLN